jgi:formiminotetrahydrofolate cyclodeaminase
MAEGAVPRVRRSWSVGEYAAAVASGDPTPGGGSVAATVAAFAAALAEMVCHLTLARPLSSESQRALIEAQRALAQLRVRFLELSIEDEVTYALYRNAAGLPKSTAEEREARRLALEDALKRAAGPPLGVAAGCIEFMASLKPIAAFGTRHARADVRTSLRLARAALQSSYDLVNANTDLMRDRATAGQLDREIESLTGRGEQLGSDVDEALENDPPGQPSR